MLFSEGDADVLMGAFQTDEYQWLVSPGSKRFARWQGTIALLLVFTAIVTPFEVAFLEMKIDGLFWVNRVVDLCFMMDMLLAFFTPVEVQTQNGIKWTVKHREIASVYLKGWFPIDVIAIFPFDVITVSSSSDTSNLKVLRIIRCARLVKLIKLGKGSAIMKIFIREHGIRNSTLQLTKFAVMMLVSTHWMGCLWMLVPKLEEAPVDWVTKYYGVSKVDGVYFSTVEGADGNDTLVADPQYQNCWNMYLTCAYWAVMTLSTIGYGDVTAATPMELFTGIVGMGIGASLYAYAVGGICGILSNRDPISSAFHDSLDCLHNLTAEYHLPPVFKQELNDFVWRSNFLFRENAYKDFFHMLSPGLQDFLVSYLHRDWIQKVWMFKLLPSQSRGRFLARVAMAMSSKAYPADEFLVRPGDPLDHMSIVKYGILTQMMGGKSKMLTKGGAFGTEILLSRGTVRSKFTVRAITYSVISCLSSHDAGEILRHPSMQLIAKHLRRLARWQIVR
jgi:potassium voltage-gated channel Eag-related subfamily H protein 7